MASEIRFSKIRQIAVALTAVTEATRFYRDVYGMRHLFDAPP